MAKMTYKMVLAEGISLQKLTIHHKNMPLTTDRVSATLYQNTSGRELNIAEDEVQVVVQATGNMVGLEWSLEITIEGEKLTEDPITQTTAPGGDASLNKSYPW